MAPDPRIPDPQLTKMDDAVVLVQGGAAVELLAAGGAGHVIVHVGGCPCASFRIRDPGSAKLNIHRKTYQDGRRGCACTWRCGC